MGHSVILPGWQSFETKENAKYNFKMSDEKKVVTETITKVSAPSNAAALKLC